MIIIINMINMVIDSYFHNYYDYKYGIWLEGWHGQVDQPPHPTTQPHQEGHLCLCSLTLNLTFYISQINKRMIERICNKHNIF